MLCVYLKRPVSRVKVTITTIQQQHNFYVHFQPGVCSSCTFSSLFWMLSSYLLWILSSLVSPPSSIYISCGHIMKSLSFKVEESRNSRSDYQMFMCALFVICYLTVGSLLANNHEWNVISPQFLVRENAFI